jgi:hypothetical protein
MWKKKRRKEFGNATRASVDKGMDKTRIPLCKMAELNLDTARIPEHLRVSVLHRQRR